MNNDPTLFVNGNYCGNELFLDMLIDFIYQPKLTKLQYSPPIL